MLCDVLHDADAPIVFTGAIRPASAAGADGPANVADAVAVAASEGADGMGVLVCFGGEIHHARCARKTDTTSLVAFSSPQTGPLGRVTEGHATIWSRVPRNPPLDPPDLSGNVLIVPSTSGDGGGLARAALATDPDGAVVGTLGAGHLAPAVLDLWAEAAERIPVIAYCRPERGVILNSTYGYAGSERDLRETNIIPTGLPLTAGGPHEAAGLPGRRPSRSTRCAGRFARTTARRRRGAAAAAPPRCASRDPPAARARRATAASTRLCPVKGRNGLPSAPVSVSTAAASGSLAAAGHGGLGVGRGVLVARCCQQPAGALACWTSWPRLPSTCASAVRSSRGRSAAALARGAWSRHRWERGRGRRKTRRRWERVVDGAREAGGLEVGALGAEGTWT